MQAGCRFDDGPASENDGGVARRSAGLLVYRTPDPGAPGAPGGAAADASNAAPGGVTGVEVLLAHPGGPLWARRDDGWWTIPKGELTADEDPLAAAEREFAEELGLAPPGGARLELGEVVQAGGKRVVAFAVRGDVNEASIVPGTTQIQWPPRSGRMMTIPEIDRVAWFDLAAARVKLLAGQRPLLDRLEGALSAQGRPAG